MNRFRISRTRIEIKTKTRRGIVLDGGPFEVERIFCGIPIGEHEKKQTLCRQCDEFRCRVAQQTVMREQITRATGEDALEIE
jgi:hypothetical protein